MVAYRYDGSFEGFLCCIFESYTKREVPAQIFSDEEAQVSPVSYTHLFCA